MVRGDVHAIALPRRRGHVQHGRRYAVVVQADDPLALDELREVDEALLLVLGLQW